ncbi:MAG: hypothetical protein K5907_06980 [Treponema sp.]|nr:hypothetical protein [Treponema sp.]
MKKLAIFSLSVFLILSMMSCGSKKPAEDTTEPTAPAVEETTEETPVEEVVSAADLDLALANMSSSRQAAIDSKAEDFAPDFFNSLEKEYDALKARAENGEDVADECNELAKKYQALAAYVKALEAKETIGNYELPAFAQTAYDKGCNDLDKFEELFDNPDATGDELLATATSAYASFKTVLTALYKEIAKDSRDDAIEAKKDADSVKAAVSQKTEYTKAADLVKKGDSLYAMNSFESAANNYKEAYDIFMKLYSDIFDKRAAALAAIEAAKKSVEESAAIAEEADLESPLTGDVDGIEAEDAVLLKEDEYAAPEDAEVYLSDDILDGGDAK